MEGINNKLNVGKDEVGKYGYFERQSYDFKAKFGDGGYPIVSKKYRLFWGKICQWSNWHSIILDLLGLSEGIITHNLVKKDFSRKDLGWQFLYDQNGVDPVLNVKSLNEIYLNTDPNYSGRMTTPCLVDITEKKVVSNDFKTLPYQLEKDFKPLHKKGAPDLLPYEIEDEIYELNEWLYDNINNAVYRTSFCSRPEAYWEDYHIFYAAMDRLEDRLSRNRFLFGDYIVDSDIKLYNTLTRLDIRYSHQLGQVKKPLYQYKNLWAYARELYQIQEFQQNTYFKDFAMPSSEDTNHIYQSFNERFLESLNIESYWKQKIDRKYLSKSPNSIFYK